MWKRLGTHMMTVAAGLKPLDNLFPLKDFLRELAKSWKAERGRAGVWSEMGSPTRPTSVWDGSGFDPFIGGT